jgi:hypothetical protein
MASSFLLRRVPVGTLLAGATLACACGSRGPLDITVIEVAPEDASTADVQVDATPEHAADGADASEATADVLEASVDTSMGMDAGALANCGNCIAMYCGTDLLTCVTSPGCGAALQCVTTTCLTGGTPNFGCITGCTMGNMTTQTQLLSVIGCLIGTCGSQCMGALGGLGGGGGGG